MKTFYRFREALGIIATILLSPFAVLVALIYTICYIIADLYCDRHTPC